MMAKSEDNLFPLVMHGKYGSTGHKKTLSIKMERVFFD
jgi:hypothetical protein